MDEIWIKAAKAFEEICGESLQRGDIKGFDDVRKKIEGGGEASTSDADPDHEAKWKKAKSAGLLSLQYLKLLVGAASKASSLVSVHFRTVPRCSLTRPPASHTRVGGYPHEQRTMFRVRHTQGHYRL